MNAGDSAGTVQLLEEELAPLEQCDESEPEQDSTPQISVKEYALLVLSLTRGWVQYGIVGFAVVCILISAVKGALER